MSVRQCPRCRDLATETVFRYSDGKRVVVKCRHCGFRWVVSLPKKKSPLNS
jgi:hypothetical protein